MGVNANIYLTGIGAIGYELGETTEPIDQWIDPKAGSRVVVTDAKAFCGKASQSAALVFMRVLETEEIAVAATAANTTVVDVGTSLALVFGDSGEFGDASDTLAADDYVAIELTDGSYHFDRVAGITSTDGSFHTDTAVSGAFDTTCKVYIFGSTANGGHIEADVSTAQGDNDWGDVIAVGRSKGDPMVVYMTASDTGAAATGNAIEGISYGYVNK
jgi:hypothetical protein